MKKIILSVVAMFLMFLTVNVEAANEKISISNVSVKDKSSTITVANTDFENNIVSSKVQFNQLDDYVLYEFTIDNKDSYDYNIDSITDNNTNTNISIDYDYDEKIKKNSTGTIQIKMTYKTESSESINISDLQFKISLTSSNGKSSIININNPETGDNIIIYVLMFTLSIASLLFLKKKSKALFIIPLLVIPFGVYASEKNEITIKFNNILVRGISADGNPVCTNDEFLYSRVVGYEITDVDACKDFLATESSISESDINKLCNGEVITPYFELRFEDLIGSNLTYDQVKDFVKEVKSTSCKRKCNEDEYLYEEANYYTITDVEACSNKFKELLGPTEGPYYAELFCGLGDDYIITSAINTGELPYAFAESFTKKTEGDAWCRPKSEQSYGIIDNNDGTGSIISYTCEGEGCSSDLTIPGRLTGKNGDVNIRALSSGVFSDKQLSSVVIPDTVTTIGMSTFAYNNMTSVVIPNSVTNVGVNAFRENELTSVTLSSNLTSIDYAAFSNNNLTSINIPNGVTTIGELAFAGNDLTEVTMPNSVTEIGDSAFYENELTSITLSTNLRRIGISAFAKNKLTSINIPNGIEEIEKNSFHSNELTSVSIPGSVKKIGQYAFYDNKIESVSIPNGVTEIERNAFNKNKITSVEMANSVTTIGESAFEENLISSLTLSNNLVTISARAFYDNNLTSVEIPSSVRTIGDYAFKYNFIENGTVPDTVTSVGIEIFALPQQEGI